MQEVEKVTYRGYDIIIAVDDEPHSPEEWFMDEVVFVSFDATWTFPEADEKHPLFQKGQHRKWKSPEDLVQFMAVDRNESASAYRVFAVTLSLTRTANLTTTLGSAPCPRQRSSCGGTRSTRQTRVKCSPTSS